MALALNALGQAQRLSVTYLGAVGRRLCESAVYSQSGKTPIFQRHGYESRQRLAFRLHSLQTQFQRRLSRVCRHWSPIAGAPIEPRPNSRRPTTSPKSRTSTAQLRIRRAHSSVVRSPTICRRRDQQAVVPDVGGGSVDAIFMARTPMRSHPGRQGPASTGSTA